jgi:hypothetical protein
MATNTTATPAAPSVFQGIEDTQTKLPYLTEGVFEARVDSVKKVQSTKDPLQVYIFTELTILESTDPNLPSGSRACRGIGTKPHPLYKMKYIMPEIKNLFGAILNEMPDKVTQQSSEALCSAKNPAAGRVINIVGKAKIDKAGVKTQFVNFTYSSAT